MSKPIPEKPSKTGPRKAPVLEFPVKRKPISDRVELQIGRQRVVIDVKLEE